MALDNDGTDCDGVLDHTSRFSGRVMTRSSEQPPILIRSTR
jgi:hypothetical protein